MKLFTLMIDTGLLWSLNLVCCFVYKYDTPNGVLKSPIATPAG